MRLINKIKSSFARSTIVTVLGVLMLGGLYTPSAGAADNDVQDYPSGLTPVYPNLFATDVNVNCQKGSASEIVLILTVEHGRIKSFGDLMVETNRDVYQVSGSRVGDVNHPERRQVEFAFYVDRRENIKRDDLTTTYLGAELVGTYRYTMAVRRNCHSADV